MTLHLPALLADPAPAGGRLWLTNATLFDGTTTAPREAAAVLVEDGRIERIGGSGEPAPEGAHVLDLEGRTLIPGLIDAHSHLIASPPPTLAGAERPLPGTTGHILATSLRRTLRMGITTVRNVGSYGELAVEVRQAARYGAFRTPRVLTCGRILSATSPGGRFFDGMYREADGADELRKAVREQLRAGADFIKVMTTGARSVEIEDPEPAQLTREEVRTIVEEAHRMGYRVAAHCEGTDGTLLAVEEGVDTIEHGMYLNQRPELLDRLAAEGRVLVPTFGCFYGVLGLPGRVGRHGDDVLAGKPDLREVGPPPTWAPILVELAEYNLEQAALTLNAARAAGVRLAMGFDWGPHHYAAIEFVRMAHHGLGAHEALVAATSGSAYALGLEDHVGRIAPGLLADLVVVDGDPLADPRILLDADRIWLVLQLGEPVAGRALEVDPASLTGRGGGDPVAVEPLSG